MDLKAGGLIMIIPTLFVALHITWKSRGIASELFHNAAVSFWICANATWMIGEFYFNDGTRPYAICFFVAGLLTLGYYYVFVRETNLQ